MTTNKLVVYSGYTNHLKGTKQVAYIITMKLSESTKTSFTTSVTNFTTTKIDEAISTVQDMLDALQPGDRMSNISEAYEIVTRALLSPDREDETTFDHDKYDALIRVEHTFY